MELKAKHKKCMLLLAAGNTKTATAKILKITRHTIIKWFKDPDFSSQYDFLQNRLLTVMQSELESKLCLVPEVIDEALNNPDIRIKLRAADILLKYSTLWQKN